MLICGGCCHDYDAQKELISQGLAERARIDVTVVRQGGNSTDTKIPVYENPNWSQGFDVVLHDECFAGVKDKDWTADSRSARSRTAGGRDSLCHALLSRRRGRLVPVLRRHVTPARQGLRGTRC